MTHTDPNCLKLRQSINMKGKTVKVTELKFYGINGRFGPINKPWKDFTFDELVEFWRSHDQKTRQRYLTGLIPKNYIGPFDEKMSLPVKPKTVKSAKEKAKTPAKPKLIKDVEKEE